VKWLISIVATVASAYALDAVAAAAGTGLVASGLPGGLGYRGAVVFLVASLLCQACRLPGCPYAR
jgi:hypothetical protein